MPELPQINTVKAPDADVVRAARERRFPHLNVPLVIVVALNLLVSYLEKKIKRKTLGTNGPEKKRRLHAGAAHEAAAPADTAAEPSPVPAAEDANS